jgi:hypothetical protein
MAITITKSLAEKLIVLSANALELTVVSELIKAMNNDQNKTDAPVIPAFKPRKRSNGRARPVIDAFIAKFPEATRVEIIQHLMNQGFTSESSRNAVRVFFAKGLTVA